MTDPTPQQVIAARKDQILDAAAVVFAEKGFHPTTIRDIAKMAGIADGTIYNYFDSKPALLMGIFERMRASIIQDSLPLPDDSDLRTFIRTFIAHPLMILKQNNFALLRIVFSEMMVNEELRTLFYIQVLQPTLMLADAYFQQHAATGATVYATLTVRAIAGMILGLMLEYIMGDPTLNNEWEQVPDVLTDFILNGLNLNEK
jgi:TetR/AcrR family fatty acid metabolism transcriptional regulator